MTDQHLVPDRSARRMAVAVFAGISLLLVGVGYWYYRAEVGEITGEKYQALAAIGELKSNQIRQWRRDRQGDASRLAHGPFLRKALENFLRQPDDANLRAELHEHLTLKLEKEPGEDVLLFSPDGHLLLSAQDDSHPADPALQRAISEALTSRSAVIGDLYRCPDGNVQIDVAVAVRDGSGRPLAVLVLRSDANAFLYPLIQTWPVPSESAESLLVQQDGEEVVFLNELRHQNNTALALRVPLTQTNLPAMQAVLGKTGVFEGKDYRGVEVLSDLRPIPESPWFLVAKVDAKEIFSDARYRAGLISLLIGLLILLAASLVALFFRHRQSKIGRDLIEAVTAQRGSEAQFRSYIDHAPMGVFVTDETGRYIQVNAAASRITGYPEAELLAMGIPDLLPPESRATGAAHFERLKQTGRATGELAFRRKNGETGYWLVDTVKLSEKRFLGFAIDTTERKRAEENLTAAYNFHIKLLENAPALIWRAGTDAKCAWFNATWLAFTGRTMEQEIGDGWTDGVHADDLGRCVKTYLEAFAARKAFEMEYRLRRHDGEHRWIIDYGIPFNEISGDFGGYIGYCFDITDRKAGEAALVTAKDQAEAAARAKSEFLAMMSHELRTPLNSVLGFAELLSFSTLDEEQRDHTQTIMQSGIHLLAVVNDILDFSSMESSTLTLHADPVAIAGLIESADLATRKAAAVKSLDFRCEVAAGVPEQITGDAQRIRQILINLLGNAVKFTAGGSVVLRVAAPSDGGRTALDFSVEDTGIGIPPEKLDRLFKPFSQADSTTSRRFGGTGLGLAISQRLAEAMGGSISVASTPGKGSTFTFHLPLSLPSPKNESGSPGHLPGRPPKGELVLIVEDDPDGSRLAGKLLQSLGYRAEFAAHGAEAVKAFAPGKFSAILMDMAMPVMDGIEATKKIREIESGPRVPIIALTANVMPGDRECCLAAGMDDFLSKPFKREELAAMLARHTLPSAVGGEQDRSALGA